MASFSLARSGLWNRYRIFRTFSQPFLRTTIIPKREVCNKRALSTTITRSSGDYEYEDPKSEDEIVNITYVLRDDRERTVRGKVGDNVMYLAHRYNIEIEGACEASLACCTCHVYVDDEYFKKLPEPKEDEEDMLDMAPQLKPNSRLSCQIILNKDLEGIRVTLPKITRNFYVDGHKPDPH
ncbi:2Fe-2S iron-sulfur cluster binding domain-containing protein [Ditylenchus destructor]|uniref:2Fe-2S iron-sulfur cluster binding domain-containing protein n=1 Tax=Ditylenchus destructor TaxID=166010 RepID=A0AAD4N6W7_9BILA|nr:2Fe-2S iron-sulfur cluster binding domain-containing protein [Ditylenchus destructor]